MTQNKNPILEFKENNAYAIAFIEELLNYKYIFFISVITLTLLSFSLKYLILPKTYLSTNTVYPNNEIAFANNNPLNFQSIISANLLPYFFKTNADSLVISLDGTNISNRDLSVEDMELETFDPDKIFNDFIATLRDKQLIYENAIEFLSDDSNLSSIEKENFALNSSESFNFEVDFIAGLDQLQTYVKVSYRNSNKNYTKDFLNFHIHKSSKKFNDILIDERNFLLDNTIQSIEYKLTKKIEKMDFDNQIRNYRLTKLLSRINQDIIIAESLGIVEPTSMVSGEFVDYSSDPERNVIEEIELEESSFWRGTVVLKGEKNFIESQIDTKSILNKAEEFKVKKLKKDLKELLNIRQNLPEELNTNVFSWSDKNISLKQDFMSDIKLLMISLILGSILGFFGMLLKAFKSQ